MTVDSTIFLDTNILLAATDRSRTGHGAARDIFARCGAAGVRLATSGQVLREYLSVATRPTAVNGLGLSVSDALSNVEVFRPRVVLLSDDEAASKMLARLVERHVVAGKRVHDANIVATILVHGIDVLATENIGDFESFPDIEVLSPEDLLGAIAHGPSE